MKERKRKQLIISLIVLLVTLAVGYAAFQDTLKISGTVSGEGNFDLVFIDGYIPQEYGKISISSDEKVLNIEIDLKYPGDGVEVSTMIQNQGNIPAKLTSFDLNKVEIPYREAEIIISFPEEISSVNPSDTILPGEICKITFTAQWDKYDTVEKAVAIFLATFEYVQDTDIVWNGTTSHIHP